MYDSSKYSAFDDFFGSSIIINFSCLEGMKEDSKI